MKRNWRLVLCCAIAMWLVSAMPIKPTIASSTRKQAQNAVPSSQFIATIATVDKTGERITITLNAPSGPAELILSQTILDGLRAGQVFPGEQVSVRYQNGNFYGDALYPHANRVYLPLVAVPTLAAPAWSQQNPLQIVGADLVGSFGVVPNATRYQLWKRNPGDSVSLATLVDDSIATNFRIPYNLGQSSNLIINGGFESGDFSGYVNTAPYAIISSADKHSGIYSALIKSTTGQIVSQNYAVASNSSYIFTVYTKCVTPSDTPAVYIQINWMDSNGVGISTDYLLNGTTPASSWTAQTNSFTSPSNAAQATVQITALGISTPWVLYIDDISLIGKSPVNTAPLFALAAIDANNRASPFSTWLQPSIQTGQLGNSSAGLDLMPNLSGVNGATSGVLVSNVRTPLPPSGITPNALISDGWLAPMTPDAVTVWQTWVYVSTSSFKVVGMDVSSLYSVGTKIRCKQGAGYVYASVLSASFSTDTTVLLDANILINTTITDNYYSYYFVSPGLINPIHQHISEDFTALCDGSKTNFTTLYTFTTNSVLLFRNGLLQHQGTDYSENSGTSITFYTAPLSIDIVTIRYIVAGSSGGGGSGAVTLVKDNFNRADESPVGAPQVGATPTTWHYNSPPGSWGIVSNQLAPTASQNENSILWDCLHAVYVLTCDISAISGDAGVIFRCVSAGGWLLLDWTTGNYYIYKYSNSNYTVVATSTTAAANGDHIEIDVTAASILVKVNGATIINITNTDYNTGTLVGFRAQNNTTFRADNLLVTT